MRSLSTILICLSALLACDDDGPPASRLDAGADAAVDRGTVDDASLDAGPDSMPDLGVDAAIDAGLDPEEAARVARIEAIYQPWVDAGYFPSVSVALVSARGVQFIGIGRGIADVAQPDTLYEIGSLSKVFTGVLLAQMIEDELVTLDTPIADLLPADLTLPAATAAIDLRALTTHHSGLPRLPDNMPFADPADPYADYDLDLLYAFLERFDAPADAGFAYSNLGVGVLGHVLGRAADADSWMDALQTRVLDPLEMAETGMTVVDPARFIQGHDADGQPVPHWAFSDAMAAAGALRSSARDMARFAQAQFDERSPLAAAIQASHAPLGAVAPGVTVGHNWLRVDQLDAVYHDGATGGFAAYLAINIEEKRAVVALYNGSAPPIADALGWTAYELWRGRDPEVPTPPADVVLTPEQLDRLTGTYGGVNLPNLVVERRDARLFVKLGEQPQLGIYPLSEVDFYLRAVEAGLRFELEMDRAVSVTLLQNGAETTLTRQE